MAARIAELQNELVEIAGRMRKFQDEYHERKKAAEADGATEEQRAAVWTPEHDKEWKDLNARYDAKKAELDREKRDADIAARVLEADQWVAERGADPQRRPHPDEQIAEGPEGRTYGDAGWSRDQARKWEQTQRDLILVWESWAGRGVPRTLTNSEEHRAACERQKFDPSTLEIEMRFSDTSSYRSIQRRLSSVHREARGALIDELVEGRALSSGLGSAGGFVTLPASVVRSIEIAEIAWGQMLEFVETMVTATGEELSWPVGDDTSNEAAYTDENVEVTSEVDPSFEATVWRSHDLQSGFVKVPFRLFRDSFVRLDRVIGLMIGERFGRKLNSEFTNGVNKIRGLIPRIPVGQTTAGATAIIWDDVVGLEHSVDPAYRMGGAYMFHDAILETLRLLKDTQDRPLWVTNIREGLPDTFNGKRYAINQDMASSVATTLKTMVYGQLASYKVRRVGPSLRLRRLVERFAERDQTAFIGYQSVDGNILRPQQDAACPVKVLQQA